MGYPILNLRGFTPTVGIVDYLRKLEEVLIRACADYGVLTQRAAGRAGVWTMPGGAVAGEENRRPGRARRLRGHHSRLRPERDHRFARLRPDRALWDSRPRRHQHGGGGGSQRPPSTQMANSVARHFGRVFGRQVVWVESLDDLLPHGHTATAGLL